MTNISTIGLVAERFDASASTPIPTDIHHLVQQAIDSTMATGTTELAVTGCSESLAALGRRIAVEEGRLLEAVVIALARRNRELTVLTGIRLPVLDAAVSLIESNQKGHVETLSLDPDGRSTRSYYPDLIIANRKYQNAIVLDVKRSIASYLGSSKLGELKIRMQAAGLALPDVLWRSHNRLAVSHVSIAIIDGSKLDADITDGVWSLAGLDELLGTEGAGVVARSAVAAFRAGISEAWTAAICKTTGLKPKQGLLPAIDTKSATAYEEAVSVKGTRGRPRKTSFRAPSAAPRSVTVGFFRPGARPIR